MNKYTELKAKQQAEVNSFPMFFAFTQQSFDKGMKRLGLEPTDTASVLSIGSGGYIRKSDWDSLMAMFARHKEEREQAIKEDKTGNGYIFQMFYYELKNHEFWYTGDTEDTLNSLGLTEEEINSNPALEHGYKKAIKKIIGEEQ
ncbi:MAG: hypothetical protein ACI4II_04980 [Acutalibacteraceae bacterium]